MIGRPKLTETGRFSSSKGWLLSSLVLVLLANSAVAWSVPIDGKTYKAEKVDERVVFHHHRELAEENGVFILTEDDVDAFVQHHDYSMILFYAPWSHKSTNLIKHYEDAAKELSNEMPPIPFAKIDVAQYPAMVKGRHLHELPQCNFMIRGKVFNLHIHEPEGQKLVDFIRRTRAPHSTLVRDESNLGMLNAHHQVVVGYFGSKDKHYQAFQGATQAFEDILFVHSHDPELRESVGAELVVFKNYEDEERTEYAGNWTSRDIKNWLTVNRFPSVLPFKDDEAFIKIFSQHNSALVLFSDKPAHEFPDYAKLAADYYANGSNLVFTHSLFSGGLGQRLAEYVGVKIDDLPSIWAIKPVGANLAIQKYKMEGKLTTKNMEAFIKKFKDGKLLKHYKSDHVIKDEGAKTPGVVLHTVGRTFDQDVKSTYKHTFVVFYYDWCLDTKKFLPIMDILAESYANNKKIDLMMMDVTLNDHPDIEDISDPKAFPALFYYDPSDKSTPTRYMGEFDEAPIRAFIKKSLRFDYFQPIELTKRRRREIMIAHGNK